jgi:endonuclease-8
MPEGDTIFRSARILHLALAGARVSGFTSALPQLTSVPLSGRTLQRVVARGKHLVMIFDGDLILRTHMRMSGSWHLYRPGERWRRPSSAARIVLCTADFEAVAFGVYEAEFLRSAQLERILDVRLGPDVLADGFDEAEALRRLRSDGARAIADALLDQRVLAGVGNVYKSEVLFLAGLHPALRVRDVPDTVLASLPGLARKTLLANVSRGNEGATGSGRRTTGRLAPSEELWVYGRGGLPCRRCGTPVAWRRHGPDARSTYWCPRCQPASPGTATSL